jgi:hypothetical protein
MKRILCLCAALLMVFGTATAFAADLTGSWSGDMVGPNGDNLHLVFTFKQDGAKLTGSVSSPMGDIEISNGKIDGNKFTFDISFNEMTIKHEGLLNGDAIKLTTKSEDGNFPGSEITLTRAK